MEGRRIEGWEQISEAVQRVLGSKGGVRQIEDVAREKRKEAERQGRRRLSPWAGAARSMPMRR